MLVPPLLFLYDQHKRTAQEYRKRPEELIYQRQLIRQSNPWRINNLNRIVNGLNGSVQLIRFNSVHRLCT